jgi:dihydrofolate reductase
MASLTYVTNMSLDGYIEDARGALDWAPPDDEVFAAATALVRSVGTFVYGRRLYEAMAVWETDPTIGERSDLTADFARAWQAADKVVYSTTLTAVPTARTRLEHHFDPDAVRELKAATSRDLMIGGANLAARAFEADLVDECRLFVWPMVLGGGKPAFPEGVRANFELVDQHRFGNGVLLLGYRVST